MLRTFSPPEHGEQPVVPVLPRSFAESSASRMNTRSAGRGRTSTFCVTFWERPSIWYAAVTGILTEVTSWPGGEVTVQEPFSSWPSRIDDALTEPPSTDHPAGPGVRVRRVSSWASSSRRSVVVTLIECWPGPTHCTPWGPTVIVVFGTYDAGGSGATAIRSRPGPCAALLYSVTVLAPAFSGTTTAVWSGTSRLPAATAYVGRGGAVDADRERGRRGRGVVELQPVVTGRRRP